MSLRERLHLPLGARPPAGTARRPGRATAGSPRLHVAMFCPYSLSLPGGVQNQTLALARALRRRGHDVRVLGPCDGPPPDAGVTPLGNSIPLAANGSVAPIAPDPAAALRTIRALRDEQFDVVHLHEPLVPGPTLTAVLYDAAPMVGTFHLSGDSASYRYLSGFTRRFATRLDVRCAVSDDAAATAREALGGEYEVLFNGVEIEQFARGPVWPTDGPTVLFVGRHEPRKGLGVLLEAFGRLPRRTRLWVAGDGPETAALRAAHDDPRIEWLGRITDAELRARWRAANVYCAPSLGGESFGIVLLESMAAGVPVVASAIGGYDLVASDGDDSLLVTPGDPAALASALTRVLGDASLAARLSAAGRVHAERFSMDELARRYEGIYQRILAAS